MGFEKIRFGKDIIFEMNGIDLDGKIIEKWRVMRKDTPKVWRILNNKYDLGVTIIDKKEKRDNKDLDWAM